MTDATPTVFVVDDDVSVRESLELLIESVGWRSQTFASAQEFLARCSPETGPSCVILDLNLPDFTGLQLQVSLLGARRHMPVIVMSGCDPGNATDRAIQGGAVAFVAKPIDVNLLLRAIEHAIEAARVDGRK